MLSDIIYFLKRSSVRGEVAFDVPLIIKSSPHAPEFRIYGACTEKNRVAVKDNKGEWHEVEERDKAVIYSLYQRLRFMNYQSFKKAI